MAAADGIARVQRVNAVRKTRLVRSLMKAQDIARLAEAALVAAEATKVREAGLLNSAQASFRDDPACEQGRIWRSICNNRLADAQVAQQSAAESADLAKGEVRIEARAVRNHDLKASKIDDYAKARRREAARLQEIRDEDELTPGAKGRKL